MRVKKDYKNRSRRAINIAHSEPADATKMGNGHAPVGPSNTEKMISQETAVRARAGRRTAPNARLRK